MKHKKPEYAVGGPTRQHYRLATGQSLQKAPQGQGPSKIGAKKGGSMKKTPC